MKKVLMGPKVEQSETDQEDWRANMIEIICAASESARKRQKDQGRRESIAAYGDVCACCGETREQFLTLNHIGGKKRKHGYNSVFEHRKLKASGYSKGIASRLVHELCIGNEIRKTMPS